MKYKDFNLTKPQASLLDLMQSGWSIRWSNTANADRRCWIEKDGVDVSVYVPTIKILEQLGIIKQDNKKPIGTYQLVE